MKYDIKDNLFSSELMDTLEAKQGQSVTDFGFVAGQRLPDEISRIFSMARSQWNTFSQASQRLDEHKSGVTETRTLWMLPFLNLLGYDLHFVKIETVDEKRFDISHRDNSMEGFPIHIISFRHDLDRHPDGNRARRQSAHVQMQEYLNHTEHLYGIITNGCTIRLLRDHHRLTGVQYIEWDLEAIMQENDLAAFTSLFRLLHASRAPQKMGEDCLLEAYHNEAVEDGHRVREQLRSNVSKCLKGFARGFIDHADNQKLISQFESGEMDGRKYWKLLRKLVYRLLFLLIAEERGLIHEPGATPSQKKLYREFYSVTRLRTLAESKSKLSPRFSDLWEQLKCTFSFFEREGPGKSLGIAPLNGDLFGPDTLGILNETHLRNTAFLEAFDFLSRFDKSYRAIRINYRRISVEEFGAVYESLLDLHPVINLKTRTVSFGLENGVDRKSTGSYYTHKDLVEQLLKTALYPVLQERLQTVKDRYPKNQTPVKELENTLLSIKVCDPACGSGHFLLAAARALATELAHIRAGHGASIKRYEDDAKRDVIEHCIYGVDLNPDALELCQLVLWIESHNAGKPITFLDHKLRCGNSLIGWLNPDEKPIIPTGAFKPVTGDDKKIARLIGQRNANEIKGVLELNFGAERPFANLRENEKQYMALAQMPSNSVGDIDEKAETFKALERSKTESAEKRMYDAWAFAFFQCYEDENAPYITQHWLEQIDANQIDTNHSLLRTISETTEAMRFFHWPLEFPDVFACIKEKRGFDVVLGNPPWERVKFQEREFFLPFSGEIASESNSATRKRLINELPKDGDLYKSFLLGRRRAKNKLKFLKKSGLYPLTGCGDIDVYSTFSERILMIMSLHGRAGFVVPTGIITGHVNRKFFDHVIQNGRLTSLFDFENRLKLFTDVDSRLKFSLITLVGNDISSNEKPVFSFFQHQLSGINDPRKLLRIGSDDFQKINPNTKTSPLFRTTLDFKIANSVYQKFPILFDKSREDNPWKISLGLMFNMASDSSNFRARNEIEPGFVQDCPPILDDEGLNKWRRIYEAKLFWHYNHRLSSFHSNKTKKRKDGTWYLNENELNTPSKLSKSWYWIPEKLISERTNRAWDRKWFLGFRKLTAVTNERTFIASILPEAGYGDSCPLIYSDYDSLFICALLGNLCSLFFDFISRLKMGGSNMAHFVLEQLPIIPPGQFSPKDLQFIVPRVLELSYTAWDLKAFADDVWAEADDTLRNIILKRWENNKLAIDIPDYETPDWVERTKGEFPRDPFRWDTQYRLQIQCELDAYFAYKYGLEEEELKYILDPTTSLLAGATQEERNKFPGETFRVLKNKEIKKYGEFRTYKLVMDAWQEKPWENPTEVVSVAENKTQKSQRNYQLAKRMPLVMARIIQLHDQRPRYARTLGKTKMEKVLHLIERQAVDMGRVPGQAEYGPADPFLREKQEANAQEQGFFETVADNPRDPKSKYRYYKLEHFQTALELFEQNLGEHQPEIDRIIQLFLGFGSDDSVLRATAYEVWHRKLQDGESATDKAIIEGCYNWSDSKKQYSQDQWQEAIQWLKENDLVP